MEPEAKWPRKNALRRMAAIVDRVPFPAEGSQSSSFSGYVGYATDMIVVQALVREVMRADLAPKPHPLWGDDGYRENAIQDALDALDWCEAWIARRVAVDWSYLSCQRPPRSWSNSKLSPGSDSSPGPKERADG